MARLLGFVRERAFACRQPNIIAIDLLLRPVLCVACCCSRCQRRPAHHMCKGTHLHAPRDSKPRTTAIIGVMGQNPLWHYHLRSAQALTIFDSKVAVHAPLMGHGVGNGWPTLQMHKAQAALRSHRRHRTKQSRRCDGRLLRSNLQRLMYRASSRAKFAHRHMHRAINRRQARYAEHASCFWAIASHATSTCPSCTS